MVGFAWMPGIFAVVFCRPSHKQSFAPLHQTPCLVAHPLHRRPDPTHVPSDPSPPEEIVQVWNRILKLRQGGALGEK
jgi:hypothetical protein